MSEGHHEIEAAKKRLAAAKATASTMASSASTMVDSAKSMEQTARTMSMTAKKNKAIAENLLQTSSNEVEEANNFLKEVEKKWEVVDVDDDVDNVDDSPKKNDKKRKKVSATNIVVGGAGLAVINGTYKKLPRTINGFDCYGKVGQWSGVPGKFIIYYSGFHWHFGFLGDLSRFLQRALYRTVDSYVADVPRKNRWTTIGEGVRPAPKLKWQKV